MFNSKAPDFPGLFCVEAVTGVKTGLLYLSR